MTRRPKASTTAPALAPPTIEQAAADLAGCEAELAKVEAGIAAGDPTYGRRELTEARADVEFAERKLAAAEAYAAQSRQREYEATKGEARRRLAAIDEASVLRLQDEALAAIRRANEAATRHDAAVQAVKALFDDFRDLVAGDAGIAIGPHGGQVGGGIRVGPLGGDWIGRAMQGRLPEHPAMFAFTQPAPAAPVAAAPWSCKGSGTGQTFPAHAFVADDRLTLRGKVKLWKCAQCGEERAWEDGPPAAIEERQPA